MSNKAVAHRYAQGVSDGFEPGGIWISHLDRMPNDERSELLAVYHKYVTTVKVVGKFGNV